MLCVTSAQSQLVTHLCVKLIPNLEGVMRARAYQAHYLIFYILTTSKSAMSPSIPDTSKVVPPHPFETFRPLTDYSNFEANVICPAIRAARS